VNTTLGVMPRLWLRPASFNLKNTEENPYQKSRWWKPTLRLYFSIGLGGKILLPIVAVGFDPKNFVTDKQVIFQNLAWKTHIQNRSRAYNKTKSMRVDNKSIKEKKKTNSYLQRKKNNITKGKNLLVPERYRGWTDFNQTVCVLLTLMLFLVFTRKGLGSCLCCAPFTPYSSVFFLCPKGPFIFYMVIGMQNDV
jgi:hypothetical protein